MKPTCPMIRPLLQAHHDRELSDPDRALVDGHLAACASCRSALEDLRRLDGLLDAWPPAAPPDGAADRLMARMADAGHPRPFRNRPALRPAFGILTAVAVLCLGWQMGTRAGRPPQPSAPPPDVLLAAAFTTDLLPAGSPAAEILDAWPERGR